MDGVLADFSAAYHAVEARLYGSAVQSSRAGDPETEEPGAVETDPERRREEDSPATRGSVAKEESAEDATEQARSLRRRREAIWQSIASTPDFWTTLAPTQEGAVRRIHELTLRHRWEVFFITQRPATEGDTVQRQTQRWLVAQGFDLPSVLMIAGSRGAAAGALRLDYHVDDSARNCIDVKSESGAKPLLLVDPGDEITIAGARRLGIGTAGSIDECLAILDHATLGRGQPRLLQKLAQLVGWS
jgi:hypothetical protein